jgi:quinol monooxygenase YgiN
MELFVFGRFRVKPGKEKEYEEALREVLEASRKEEGCLEIHGYRSVRDARLYYVHSRWKSEAAFDEHAKLAYTVKYLERVEELIEHELDVTRTVRIG